MTRTPFSRVPGAASAVRFTTTAIGALVLVPPSRPTAVAAPAVAGKVDDPPARMSFDDHVGRTTRAERDEPSPASDLATRRGGSVLSGGGPAPKPNRSAAPLSDWAVEWSRPADQSTRGLRGRTSTTTSVDDLDPNSSAGPGASGRAAFPDLAGRTR